MLRIHFGSGEHDTDARLGGIDGMKDSCDLEILSAGGGQDDDLTRAAAMTLQMNGLRSRLIYAPHLSLVLRQLRHSFTRESIAGIRKASVMLWREKR